MIYKKPNVVTIVQARTGSTRLPGKILLPLLGETVLARMIERVKKAAHVGEVVVATTVLPEDELIVEECRRIGVASFQGHPLDLLDRHYRAGRTFNADLVVKIPSDCPLIDPKVIDQVIEVFLKQPERYDYVGNLHPPSFPDGNDVEVFNMHALETAWIEARKPFEREHTTPYLWMQPQRFSCANVSYETGKDYSKSHRFVLDYPEDYSLVKEIFEALYLENSSFGIDSILAFLKTRPQILTHNQKYLGETWMSRLGINENVSPAA